MRSLCFLLAGCLALPLPPALSAQEPAHKLNLLIVEGDGAINNIRQRTAREPIVQVEDENHRPVAGAAVLFLLPSRGAGGTFADGSHSLTVVSALPEASMCPSRLKATESTGPVCPCNVLLSLPVAASHSFTVLSSPPVATVRPSGL